VYFYLRALEKVRDSGTEPNGTIHNKTIRILAYTDDIVLGRRFTGILEETTINLCKRAKEMGLNNEFAKPKYMEVTKMPSNLRKLKVDEQKFERVRELRCLGSTVTEGNNIITKIKQRIVMANQASYGLKKQLSSRYLGRQTKCALYTTLVGSILTYGSERWLLKRKPKICSESLKERYYEECMAQLRKMICEDQGKTMSFINYVMNQIW
jgi:hypothetical protein